MILMLCSIFFGLFFLYILLPWGFKLYLRPRMLAKVKSRGCVCLTFDDGPHPDSTPRILDILDEAKVKATFFLIGKKAEQYPDIVGQIVARGHEIGEHGYLHRHAWRSAPLATINDLARGGRVLDSFLKDSPIRLFRPPYGKLNLAGLLYLWWNKRRLAYWNIDPRDYKLQTPRQLAEYVIPRLESGSVILLHDGRGTDGDNQAVTVEGARLILQARIGRKMRIELLGDILR